MTASQDSAVELSEFVTELLGRFGVAGTVTVDGARVTLSGSGPTVGVDAEALLAEWPSLGRDDRRRRALDMARRLANERRRITGRSRAPAASRLPTWTVLVGLAASIAAAVFHVLGASPDPSSAHVTPRSTGIDYDAEDRERRERADRVCDATRSRVMRGAAVGASDAEGWVVELSILRAKDGPPPGFQGGSAPPAVSSGGSTAPPALDSAIPKFFAATPKGRRIVWSGAGALRELDGPDTDVAIEAADMPETGPAELRGLRVVFSGRYVAPYFDDTSRATYVRLAIAFSDALKADYAALYARCSAGRSHHLGSYFRGPTPGGAIASLLLYVGTSGDVPDVRRALLSPDGKAMDQLFAFHNVVAATAPLKKVRVMAMVGAEGGMISGLDDQPSAVTFPPRDANRAARASHEIARNLGLGEDR